METGLVWLEAKLVEAERAWCPANGGTNEAGTRESLDGRVKANVFAQDEPGQALFQYIDYTGHGGLRVARLHPDEPVVQAA